MVVQMYSGSSLPQNLLDERHEKTLIRSFAKFFVKKTSFSKNFNTWQILIQVFFPNEKRTVACPFFLSLLYCVSNKKGEREFTLFAPNLP